MKYLLTLKLAVFWIQLCVFVVTFHNIVVNAQITEHSQECESNSSGTCIYKPNLVYIMTASTSNRLLLTCNDNGDLVLTKTMDEG